MLALFRDWGAAGPAGWYADWLTRTFSPYQFNPLDFNPLRDIVAEEVDFERVRAFRKLQLFVSATNVRTGELKEFRGHEITVEAVMASACLPTLFRAVQIGSESYWDGGYVGNPSLLPLIADSPAHDLLLVQINPSSRPALPTRPQEILDRMNEITFNASLVKELRTIALLKSLLKAEGLPPGGARASLFQQIAELRLHRIHAEEEMSALGASSKMNAAWPLVQRLYRIGREAAHDWLDRNFTHLGRRATLPLEERL
jgi:NTE family protein